MSNTMRGGDIVARSLETARLQEDFHPIRATHIMSLFDATLETKIKLVHVRHEAAAVQWRTAGDGWPANPVSQSSQAGQDMARPPPPSLPSRLRSDRWCCCRDMLNEGVGTWRVPGAQTGRNR